MSPVSNKLLFFKNEDQYNYIKAGKTVKRSVLADSLPQSSFLKNQTPTQMSKTIKRIDIQS
jgi:hypothetical protein